MRTLVTGWFSFPDGEATVGDLRAAEVVCSWLEDADVDYDLAASGSFQEGVDWRDVPPTDYSCLVFVCGPAHGADLGALLDRFSACRRLGVDVSLVPDQRPAFDAMLERDGGSTDRPDLAIATPRETVPLVAVIRAHPQPEYGEGLALQETHAALDRMLAGEPVATMELDTRVDPLETGRRTCAQVEEPIGRVDAVVTTRLHGLVTALKMGVPALAIDAVRGGGKVSAQARALSWPYLAGVDDLDVEAMSVALRSCLQPEARQLANRCRDAAVADVDRLAGEIRALLGARQAAQG